MSEDGHRYIDEISEQMSARMAKEVESWLQAHVANVAETLGTDVATLADLIAKCQRLEARTKKAEAMLDDLRSGRVVLYDSEYPKPLDQPVGSYPLPGYVVRFLDADQT